MAKRTSAPSEREPARLSSEQIQSAIPKLERRLREIEAIDADAVRPDSDFEMKELQMAIDATLVEIFEKDTLDYRRYNVSHPAIYIGRANPSAGEVIDGFRKFLQTAELNLSSALKALNEKLEDAGATPGARAVRAYEGLDLHPEIARRVNKLYLDGHHAEAVNAACKALRDFVRFRSGINDLDGTALMERVFSTKNPVLRFNDLASQSDRDEQKGMMMLFSGAMTGLRNPRAHEFIEEDPERALEFIAFISLLAKMVDRAESAD